MYAWQGALKCECAHRKTACYTHCKPEHKRTRWLECRTRMSKAGRAAVGPALRSDAAVGCVPLLTSTALRCRVASHAAVGVALCHRHL